jgi:hypothetical protein
LIERRNLTNFDFEAVVVAGDGDDADTKAEDESCVICDFKG